VPPSWRTRLLTIWVHSASTLLPSFHLIGCKLVQNSRRHPIPCPPTRVTPFSHPTSLAEKYRPLLWLPARVLPPRPRTAHPRPSHKDRRPRPPISCAGELRNNFGHTTTDGDAGWLAGPGQGSPKFPMYCFSSRRSRVFLEARSHFFLAGLFCLSLPSSLIQILSCNDLDVFSSCRLLVCLTLTSVPVLDTSISAGIGVDWGCPCHLSALPFCRHRSRPFSSGAHSSRCAWLAVLLPHSKGGEENGRQPQGGILEAP
jgi:hypothetical protein